MVLFRGLLPPHTPSTHFDRSKSSSLAYRLAFVFSFVVSSKQKELLPVSMPVFTCRYMSYIAVVCVFACGHFGPLSHVGHDPIDRLGGKYAGPTSFAGACTTRPIYIYISFAGFGKQHPGSTFPGQNGTNAACMVWGKKAGCSLKAQYCAYDIHI